MGKFLFTQWEGSNPTIEKIFFSFLDSFKKFLKKFSFFKGSHFLKYNNFVEEGDTVIIYVNPGTKYSIVVKRGKTIHMKYGALRHEFLIGKRFGNFLKILFSPSPIPNTFDFLVYWENVRFTQWKG